MRLPKAFQTAAIVDGTVVFKRAALEENDDKYLLELIAFKQKHKIHTITMQSLRSLYRKGLYKTYIYSFFKKNREIEYLTKSTGRGQGKVSTEQTPVLIYEQNQ